LNELNEHEKAGVEIARKVLPDFGYEATDIDCIVGMIMATKIPQSPKTKLERIICDADLDYLGRDDFYSIGKTLFEELKQLGYVDDEKNWDMLQIDFLRGHEYHTDFSIQYREPEKQRRLNELLEKWK